MCITFFIFHQFAIAPPLRGLFPRHLRAANASIFVHAPIRPQTAPVRGGKGKKLVKKIVQNCALLCSSMNPGVR
ncbi:hypothetical protein DOI44_09785 [Salmonella enterica subsp. enterica serovar Panama]|uniref:Uncharacterized protein n=1 Tax=Salmonella enterica subsp. enterica serovar Panama TaxID=29472 RepID=A0A5U8J9V4_SALET|nr:hypothetical protein LFZ16_25340 [Salmonella enterica subsp. enterica serovar India str. SA20085604]EBR7992648.1 hypothetical protein [Salmonella enterica subsp. enterica serovar Panama]EBR8433311.1 hypothetical protein [Salmonella enterica subsp. enterica serovar Panama]EBW9462470.1 hypothetical protein [Salmonella enterica subsp. enterica serovar Panama]ECI3668982.1 hypothetical protein [Salmonella enterica subsp. diarizonae]